MASTAVAFYFLVFWHCIIGLDANCGHIKYNTIKNTRRSTAYNATHDLCDRYFIQSGSWYRFKSVAGGKMPEFNPGLYHCGTYIPIWMNGNHPSNVGVEVDRTACAPVPNRWPPGCGYSLSIKVINCGSFFLYQLQPPRYCTIAYCAGTQMQQNCSSDGTSIPVCPGVVPVILGRPNAGPKDEDREFVALSCSWNYGYDASHVEFHVRWFRDSNDSSHAFECKVNGTAAPGKYECLYEHKLHFQRITNGQSTQGYEWNKKAYCKVRGRFHGGYWSRWKSSKTIFTGIVVHPQEISLNECGDNKEVLVSLRPHLPIRKRDFTFEVGYNGVENVVGDICVRGTLTQSGVPEHRKCLAKMTEWHKPYHPFWISITAICQNTNQNEPNLNPVEVKFNTEHIDPKNNEFWTNYVFPPIKISMTARNTKTCRSTTDPNILTFDGRFYNPGTEGTYRLYRNRISGTEVQARINYCCNCGVALKEGFFYKIVELCTSIDQGDSLITANIRHTPDMAQYGFYTESSHDGFTLGKTIIVHLPSGTAVTIVRRWSSLDIHIDAPEPYYGQVGPDDQHRQSEGLCGNFNGNPDDDFEHLSNSEFYELHRIQSGSSEDIFAYQGNDADYKKLYDACSNESVCICRNGRTGLHECNTTEAIKQCAPPQQDGRIPTNLCNGNLEIDRNEDKRRRKRALDLRDDNVDDQDDIPPYNPPIRNFTAPSWPTPSGLTEENVTEICNKRIRYSKGGESCSGVAGVDLDTLVNQCISDIKLTDDISWAIANFGAMKEVCQKNVYKNITYYKNSTDGKLSLETTVLDSLCPNDCSDRGNCSNSTCTCFEDYTAADCSISLKDSPILYGIRKSGLCDIRRRPCRNVGIYAYPLLDSKNLTCHVQEVKVIESVWTPDSYISLHPGLMMDINEVKCSLPESPVNIGDYGNEGVTAAGLMIAVSNNRINASKDSMLFITYDSVCQECNTSRATTKCRLKTDACFISSHCFAQNQSHPDDWCQQCLPQISTNSWEKRRDNQRPRFLTSPVLHAFLGKELRVQLSAIDPENRTIQFTFAKNSTLGASLTSEGLFTCTKNTNDSTIYTFNVTDECGAHSVLDATVVISECLCLNSGDCHPDYRYLDGAGNFTCSCPVEYTGTLCELDVDECNVSKPCLNGSCNNLQPGFSCSCFPGYTGNLCQNEIDECASNPCFVGVPCTDMLASFICGACPSEYTGNGENCTRLDGKVDECVKTPQVCHSNAKCVLNNGSYVCQCSDGYTGDGKSNCRDVNECSNTPSVCHENATCLNFNGSYSCQCKIGYSGNGKINCTDIDECQQSPSACHSLANCSNTEGSFSCPCNTGYTGDGNVNCTDVDECSQSPSVCHQHAKCSNAIGSYSCQCQPGFSGDGIQHCADIDECVSQPSICHQFANCSNVAGSYSCHCRAGFSGNGKLSCDDIDECQQSPSACHSLANCSNTEGSFSCQCNTGYTGDGKVSCTDVDECSQSPSVCHQHAKCSNAIGSYSCQCQPGFLGDGIQYCAENQPPQFTTPNAVYAILSNDFRIQLVAEDPENQRMTFTLLSNGTLSTAQLMKQLLTISNLRQNGTVFVQVEDEMGAKTILILEVNAFECPCEHKGKCYQKQNISYPVQPSDYYCQCEDPYTGDVCEIRPTRPNPCNELPCYPGLECSPSQDSEAFTCEECPPSFQGNGKHCELKPTEEQSLVESELKLTDQEWDDSLKTSSSRVYKNLVSQLTIEIRNIYKNHAGFSYVIIKGFRRGSIIVNFQLIFMKKVDDPLKPLMEVVETGKLGNMTVKMKIETRKVENKEDSSEDNIFGLDKTIFYVIVGAAVVFILMVSLAIYLRIKRLRTHREAKLRARVLKTSNETAEGIAYQAASDANNGEEIDLNVFDNEAVCLDEEIKMQP